MSGQDPAEGKTRAAAPGEGRLRERCLSNALWPKFYEGWELIGRGAYGTVVGTRHGTLGSIAVKVFEWLSPVEEARFDQEAAALARLLHPCVVRIYGVFKDDGLYWFEMERVSGSTLKEALDRREAEGRPFELNEALDVAIDITEALKAAHDAGVIHRDVKPANVLLPEPHRPPGPRAKLGDFGVSRLFDASRRTATGVVVGSYEYAAPELFAGRSATTSSDVYSFTVLLYRLLTGNAYPYEINGDRTPVAYMEAHTKQVALPVGLLNRELNQDLQDIITLGLSKDPRRRPSWDDILGVLRASHTQPRMQVTKAEPVAAAAHSGVSRSWSSRGLRPIPAAARYVLGVSAIGVAAAGLMVVRGPAETARGRSAEATALKHQPRPSPATAARPDQQALITVGGTAIAATRPVAVGSVVGIETEIVADALKVRNVSDRRLSVRVTVVAGSGRKHSIAIRGLDGGLQHTVYLDALQPPVTDAGDIQRIEVVELKTR